MLNELVADLSVILSNRSEGYVHRVEDKLAEIAALKDPACIGLLLPFFDDEAEYYEMMYSIIRVIESFDDHTYVREILENLAPFFTKSPRWAVSVHMAIFNSPSALAAYEARVKTLSDDKKLVVRDVLTTVRQKNTKFEK